MVQIKKKLVWVLSLAVGVIVVFLLWKPLFYKEPAKRFLETNDVPALIQSIKELEVLLEKDPNQPEKQLELAHCYKIVGRYDKAIKAFGKAWGLVHQRPQELVEFANVLARYRGNDFKGKPIELLEQAIQMDPKHVDALISYGAALLSIQEKEKAIEYWNKALELLETEDLRRAELLEMLEYIQQQ